MKVQTKLGSFVEAWVNVLVGFGVSFLANLVVLPWFGFDATPAKAFWIGVIFTVISLIRSYFLRRFFNSIAWGNIRQELNHERDSARRAE